MKNLINNKRGNALAYVMMVMIVVFILVGAVVSLAQANIRQAGAQEKGMQAYYLARSGAELAFEAMLNPSCNVLTQIKNKTLSEKAETVSLDNGTAAVKVTLNDSKNPPKIHIESVGTLNSGGISKKVTLEFNTDYTTTMGIVWSD